MNEDDFQAYLDNMMWEGYAARYKKERPQEYYNELIEFLSLHVSAYGR